MARNNYADFKSAWRSGWRNYPMNKDRIINIILVMYNVVSILSFISMTSAFKGITIIRKVSFFIHYEIYNMTINSNTFGMISWIIMIVLLIINFGCIRKRNVIKNKTTVLMLINEIIAIVVLRDNFIYCSNCR